MDIQLAILLCSISLIGGQISRVSQTESLYDITLSLTINSCNQQKYRSLCGGLTFDYKECEVWTNPCNPQAKLRVSFPVYKSYSDLEAMITAIPKTYEGMTITSHLISDVNECTQDLNQCSRNGYCINTQGTYRCECGFGFKAPLNSSFPVDDGTYCVARCNARSCRMGAICSDATDEVSSVTCACEEGYSGENCETRLSTFPQWGVISIAVLAGVSALIGLTLCIYTCYRLTCRKSRNDDDDANSINDYKPRAMPASEYDRFTDLGSLGRSNRGFASTIDEESERGTIKNDGLMFGRRLLSPRLSIPSEHGDPTPVLDPYQRTERHNADVESQPDYY